MTPPKNTSPTTATPPRLAEIMEPTRDASVAAHDAFLRAAMQGTRWERRGLLGRLTRTDP